MSHAAIHNPRRLKCEAPTDQIFVFQTTVLNALKQFIQSESDSQESGGLLIGRTDIETKAKIIIASMAGDRQTRTSFFRSKSHQKALIKAWNDSEKFIIFGVITYTS